MIAVNQYLTIKAERKKVRDEDLAKKYDSGIKRIAAHLDKIDTSFAKVEEYLHKLRGVRLEAMEDEDERTDREVEAVELSL